MNYIPYHIHSDYSLLDSCTQYTDYIDKAVELGMTAIAFSEHGKISGWFKKMQYCKEKGIKYIHAVECYLTESLTNKVRDNYHTILIAKNKKGFEELNLIIGKSFDRDHFYYVNRISFDEFLSLSDNIITTSACLAGPLNKLDKANPYYERLVGRYDYLEIQPHDDADQKAYNIDLACIAEQYNKPLIAGTDTHSLNQYKAECRKILMKYKKQSYGNEDNFDLTFKTYDELVTLFRKQGVLTEQSYLSAINNTNTLAELVEDYDIDLSIKYPLLYGSREKDHEKLVETINQKFQDKIDRGVISQEQIPAFKKAIDEEMAVFTKTGMDGFMLSEAEILDWCRSNGIVTGPARGSVSGSRVAYITDIIGLNPETWHTVFSRFANEDRVEVGDIDTDVTEQDRPKIFEYIRQRFGETHCARVSAFGTIADRAAIDLIGGALREYWDEDNPGQSQDNPYSLDNIKIIKKEYGFSSEELRKQYEDNPDEYKIQFGNLIDSFAKKYPEIFKYYKGMVGTKVSQSIHPAGMVISPIELPDNYGVFDKDGDSCLFLDMEECHDAGLVKYDFLCLVNVQILKDTCALAGVPYPKFDQLNYNDESVWNDMLKSSAGIFQMESDFAFRLLTEFRPRSIQDMSLVTASMRPSGASYRNELMKRIYHDSGSPQINEILKDSYGHLVYQEDVIRFLQEACGFSGSKADTTRRAIVKKQADKIQKLLVDIVNGYCALSPKSKEEATVEATQFVKVIEDASRYMFGYNHSVGYCLLGYACAYFRKYYPIEFITSLLNNSKTEEDVTKFTDLANTYGIPITTPRYRLSKGHYFPDEQHKSISKGIASIKFISDEVADDLYNIAHTNDPKTFVDLLRAIKTTSKINSKQLDILIKINFFSEFGNVRELLQIYKMFDLFDCGNKLGVSKDKFQNADVINILNSYTNNGLDKNGKELKTYRFSSLDDVIKCANEIEQFIKSLHLKDLNPKLTISNYVDILGYVPATGLNEDRMTLVVSDCNPILSNTGKIWQYRTTVQSLGSGKSARLSVSKELYEHYPIKRGDVITAKELKKDNKGYWHLANYNVW